MKIGIYYFHTDPDYYFQVKNLVNATLNDICQKEIFDHEPLVSVKPDWVFSINVTVLPQQETLLYTDKPTIDKRNKFDCYTILLPPKYITPTKEYPLDKYIEFFFEGLRGILLPFNIDPQIIENCKQQALSKIVGNPDYDLLEEERLTEKMSDERSRELDQELLQLQAKKKNKKDS